MNDRSHFEMFCSFQGCPNSPQPSHGYLSSSNLTLLSAHGSQNDIECYELYQQTEILPNPLKEIDEDGEETFNDFNVKFTIGDEICSNFEIEKKHCNGQLSPNTKYGLIARIFTSHGFRDTDPVYINIEVNLVKLMSPNAIVYGSVSFVILLSLVVFLCCIWSHRAKSYKLKKEKEAAEADENLLSFTSYCVIDKNPLPRKTYAD